MLVRHAVRLPESFRGGCSFGAGAEADLSRRDVLNRWEENTGLPSLSTQPQHYQRDLRAYLVCCGNPMIRLHSFWTVRRPMSKSVPLEEAGDPEPVPAFFPIG
jgi:hypothetical protein